MPRADARPSRVSPTRHPVPDRTRDPAGGDPPMPTECRMEPSILGSYLMWASKTVPGPDPKIRW